MTNRQHAAIMFTDIVGYTRLMGSDEEKAVDMLSRNRSIHQSYIKKFNGTLIKEIGDGILASFSLASEAVRCAIEIQKACKEDGIPLRIGIHEGEMIFSGSDVIGDGVNIASRLQEDAQEGCINISATVYSDIKNKSDIKTKLIGDKFYKNIDELIRVYRVCNREFEEEENYEILTQKDASQSIAVLPFVNMSNDTEQEYFCDGITEEIINALTHVESLKVIARTSAFVFKNKHEDIREIGKKLNVATLLEGSVRKAGNRVRITAQLIKVSDGTHLWSERYDRDLEDIFVIQDEISLTIVNRLKIKLIKKEITAITKKHTDNLEAYNLYLKGRYYTHMLTPEGLEKARDYYKKSLHNDPNFALAYVGLNHVPFFQSFWDTLPPREAFPKAKEYLQNAVEIDDTISEIHTSLGLIYMFYDWNFKDAEKAFLKALELNPNSVDAHIYYSWFLVHTDQYNKAIIEAKQAQKLDPLSSFINTYAGLTYLYAGDFDKSIEEQQLTISMNPRYFTAYHHLGMAYFVKQMINEAIISHEKAADLSGGDPWVKSILAILYNISGDSAKSMEIIDGLSSKANLIYIPATCLFNFYNFIGEEDEAFYWLKKAVEERDSFLNWAISFVNSGLGSYPDDPRFKLLLKNAGLENRGK